ncbi:hypothetical protein EON81_19695 [bacterium]|nr:MAG: hypothetical protein EON81_19695 [bacterium]
MRSPRRTTPAPARSSRDLPPHLVKTKRSLPASAFPQWFFLRANRSLFPFSKQSFSLASSGSIQGRPRAAYSLRIVAVRLLAPEDGRPGLFDFSGNRPLASLCPLRSPLDRPPESERKTMSHITRKRLLALGLVTVLFPVSALAHETKCPYCKMDVVQDTKEIDNEVILRYGNKRIEYRCVLCALAQAKTKYTGDVTIVAPSTIKGKPLNLKRVDGEWTAPGGAVFVYQKGSHAVCQDIYRAATDKEAAEAWIKTKGSTEAKILTLKEMLELSK